MNEINIVKRLGTPLGFVVPPNHSWLYQEWLNGVSFLLHEKGILFIPLNWWDFKANDNYGVEDILIK